MVPGEPAARTGDAVRAVAQLNMLHHLAARLNALVDVVAIGEAITAELRTIVDYHNCRVYVLQPDGTTLYPIAFSGELFSEYEEETLEELETVVGEGITGWVAHTRTSLLTPDAREVAFAVQIPGTDDILESMLGVPMVAGDELVGVIVLSSLGYGMFDEDDRRMLEVLAPHAAVAIQKASLLRAERDAAEGSAALLGMSQSMTQLRSVGDILREAVETASALVPCVATAAYIFEGETARYRLARMHRAVDGAPRLRREIVDIPGKISAPFVSSVEPFVVPEDRADGLPSELHPGREAGQALIAPIRWDPDGLAAIVLVGDVDEHPFDERSLRLVGGIADITSLAVGNASRMSELERFRELAASLDAVFWEASADDLVFDFVGGRSGEILGEGTARLVEEGSRWGEHILEEDREAAVRDVRATVDEGLGRSLEYRVRSSQGEPTWIRDVVHAVAGRSGTQQLRGLMVDVTERKRAEDALRKSERQASSAFRRERQASQQLRELDEMKNTFLEAVSHDLRTPLTSILGSALTLEQSWSTLEANDARDLAGRVASNARKLERLLKDLLDMDRLQRGIISPQRRPTELRALVERVVLELEHPSHVVTVEVPEITASVDASKVERILENLLMNAVRHTPRGSHVWVRGGWAGGAVELMVEDDGPGVPEALRDEVFEPFRQAPGSSSIHSPGVGIGLSLVQRFAQLHGGRAWVEDREGGGASFRLLLPVDGPLAT